MSRARGLTVTGLALMLGFILATLAGWVPAADGNAWAVGVWAVASVCIVAAQTIYALKGR